jgi:hypothetical protein
MYSSDRRSGFIESLNGTVSMDEAVELSTGVRGGLLALITKTKREMHADTPYL